jgi:hypothetical protein
MTLLIAGNTCSGAISSKRGNDAVSRRGLLIAWLISFSGAAYYHRLGVWLADSKHTRG